MGIVLRPGATIIVLLRIYLWNQKKTSAGGIMGLGLRNLTAF
jgi:hypothetical protein